MIGAGPVCVLAFSRESHRMVETAISGADKEVRRWLIGVVAMHGYRSALLLLQSLVPMSGWRWPVQN